ncbi:MAG: hypothetical protein JWM80_6172 [Cyanobacteria bacterium RYN_339]|nr:hypothetical protein [Cyanobacteria bacterium RYN_339]
MRTRSTARWMLEAVLFLALAAAVGALLDLPPGGGQLLLAAVVLVAAMHGLAAGVATGALAGLAALVGSGAGPSDLVELSGNRAALGPAFAHLGFGTLAGLAAEGHRRAGAAGRDAFDQLAAHADDLEARLAAVTAARGALERRLAAEVVPVEALAVEAAGLGAHGLAAPIAALALAKTYLQARVAGFYVEEGEGWRLQTAQGAPPAGGPWTDGPIARAAREGRAISTRRRGPDGAWLAAPVRRADGTLVGVLAIHDLPFTHLTPVAPRALAVLADALGAAFPPAGVVLPWTPARERQEGRALPEAG